MNKNSYLIMFDEYIKHYNKIRGELNLPQIINGYKVFEYNKYLSDNVEIKKHIVEIMKGQGNIDLFIGYTGSGKSYSLIDAGNSIVGTKREDGKFPIIVKANPGTRQCLQESNSYSNVVCYNESKQYNINDIYNNKVVSIVYDKLFSFRRFLKENNLLDSYYIVLIVDECHSSISDTYRKIALKQVQSFVKFTKENSGNVIYTTATFSNTYVLDIKTITFCCPKQFGNVGHIEEINCPEKVKAEEFLLNNLIILMNQGYKPCLRLNNIDLMNEIKDNLEIKLGYRVSVVNSTNQKSNEVAQAIEKESFLLDEYDCYIFTCLLDSATNIKGVKTKEGEIIENNKICPCFFINKLNTNMDNISQFVARFRFKCEKAQVFVAHHGQREEQFKSLAKIVSEQAQLYVDEYESFELSLRAAKLRYKEDCLSINREMNYILNECNSDGIRNDRGGIFSYENGTIVFDLYECFNRLYNLYQNQFLVFDEERHKELEKRFGSKLTTIEYKVAETPCGFIDYTSLKFDKFCEDLQRFDVVNRINEIGFKEYIKELEKDKKYGSYMKQIEKDERFEYLYKLVDYEPLEFIINDTLKLQYEEIKTRLSSYQRYDLITLTREQINQISNFYNEDVEITDEKLKRVIDSKYNDLLKEANRLNISLRDFINLCKKLSIEELEYWLLEENVIQNNKKYNMGINLGGSSGRELFHFRYIVEYIKNGKNEMKIDEKTIKKIKEYMGKKCKNSWGKTKVTKYLKLMYNYKVQDDKIIIIKNLRLKHS